MVSKIFQKDLNKKLNDYSRQMDKFKFYIGMNTILSFKWIDVKSKYYKIVTQKIQNMLEEISLRKRKKSNIEYYTNINDDFLKSLKKIFSILGCNSQFSKFIKDLSVNSDSYIQNFLTDMLQDLQYKNLCAFKHDVLYGKHGWLKNLKQINNKFLEELFSSERKDFLTKEYYEISRIMSKKMYSFVSNKFIIFLYIVMGKIKVEKIESVKKFCQNIFRRNEK